MVHFIQPVTYTPYVTKISIIIKSAYLLSLQIHNYMPAASFSFCGLRPQCPQTLSELCPCIPDNSTVGTPSLPRVCLQSCISWQKVGLNFVKFCQFQVSDSNSISGHASVGVDLLGFINPLNSNTYAHKIDISKPPSHYPHGHDYTISTLDVLKACDACADIGQSQCSSPHQIRSRVHMAF